MRTVYSPLQLREIFHLEFLRWLGRKLKTKCYALKGGVNLRFFFNSIRYSEDMDLDAFSIEKNALIEIVLNILGSASFTEGLKEFGIERIIPPNISSAKQTQTTQRFKAHLITFSGEDLFTKIEFSRRGPTGNMIVQTVKESILRAYKMSPLPVPHYDIKAAIAQKIDALGSRAMIQARDLFDLYMFSTQYQNDPGKRINISEEKSKKAAGNIFEISFGQFKDTVVNYLASEDKKLYSDENLLDEIKTKVAEFIKEATAVYEK